MSGTRVLHFPTFPNRHLRSEAHWHALDVTQRRRRAWSWGLESIGLRVSREKGVKRLGKLILNVSHSISRVAVR